MHCVINCVLCLILKEPQNIFYRILALSYILLLYCKNTRTAVKVKATHSFAIVINET